MKNRLISVCISLGLFLSLSASAKCVQIFYDKPEGDSSEQEYGRHLAGLLQNLLGHFPKVKQKTRVVQKYQSGQIEDCDANIYLSSAEDTTIPKAFIEDFANTEKTAVWVGYNIDQIGAKRLKNLWGVKYEGLGELEYAKDGNKKKEPGFFKFYDYKGETFVKIGEWDEQGQYEVQGDVALLDVDDDSKDNVVSWMRHNTTKEKRPYILRNDNHWLVGDMPLSYVQEEDRYLIFADLLFDFLKEAPQNKGPRPALVRFEDVSAATPIRQLMSLMNAAGNHKIPFSISLIPIYKNAAKSKTIPMTEKQDFIDVLNVAQKNHGTILMHGTTHQSDNYDNPSGESGIDYEFWDEVKNKPMPNDSPEFVVNRLEQGITEMSNAGITPAAWLCPHYGASVLDEYLFAQLFHWNIGRAMYAPYKVTQAKKLPDDLTFDNAGPDRNDERLSYLSDVKVTAAKTVDPEGQFFPYEIYRDIYGQHIIPENLGYIRPTDEGAYAHLNMPKDILRMLKRNRVLRDVWGSLYIHPYIVDTKDNGGIGQYNGDTRPIEQLLQKAQSLGYQFVDLKEYFAGEKGK
jgi:uncharacterized protein YdaL